jgi:peptide/nickel transport system ATP-binding protein
VVLNASNLDIEYRIHRQWLSVIRDVSLTINAQEIHGLVGESGSGKSTLAMAFMRFLAANARITGGTLTFMGRDVLAMTPSELSAWWGKEIALVPQNPLEALNPTLTIGRQMTELTQRHLGLTQADAIAQAKDDLERVEIADGASVLMRYPHQLSGGMQQRVMIAMALSTRPALLILDEPTTALDVTTQAVILDLIRMRVKEAGASALYVSHNLGTIAQLCDVVTVLYGGEVMETGPVEQVFRRPVHPYTIGLMQSIPRASTESESRLSTIGGFAPALDQRSAGCAFASRCPIAFERCHSEKPSLEQQGKTGVRCWRADEIVAGAVEPQFRVAAALESAPPLADVVLDVRHLSKSFSERRWWHRLLGIADRPVKAVEDVSFHVNGRSTLGIVGESGSGKTTLARAIVALTPADEGSLTLLNQPISLELDKRDRNTLKNLRLIFQNPNDALNPHRTVGQAVGRTLRLLARREKQPEKIAEDVAKLLISVGLAPEYASRYPRQLSGGEKQRVAIARALAANPAIIVADEPTSALDVSVQAVIVNLLKDIRTRNGLSYLVISHDLELIGYLADWIVVMYLGEIVEQGSTEQVHSFPSHPYTEALISAIPVPDPTSTRRRIRLDGEIPSPRDKPSGCPFHTRCHRLIGDICKQEKPPRQRTADNHEIRCHIPLDELAALQAQGVPNNGDSSS